MCSGRTLVLVAHPDDECIAFGALLQRIREPLVVFATNGSPADPYFWQKYGSREAYAEIAAAGGDEVHAGRRRERRAVSG